MPVHGGGGLLPGPAPAQADDEPQDRSRGDHGGDPRGDGARQAPLRQREGDRGDRSDEQAVNGRPHGVEQSLPVPYRGQGVMDRAWHGRGSLQTEGRRLTHYYRRI